METGTLTAVGVWFRSRDTGRYLYLLRNDIKHPGTWALPGGKLESGVEFRPNANAVGRPGGALEERFQGNW
jgi:8-oxo-dGTP pyrophosphatase MutT (NUDIX family)